MASESGENTTLSGAASNTKSLRTTVPIGLARQFGLKEGDRINWQMKIENGELVMVVRPTKKDEKK